MKTDIKREYENPGMDLVELETEDVITTSGGDKPIETPIY